MQVVITPHFLTHTARGCAEKQAFEAAALAAGFRKVHFGHCWAKTFDAPCPVNAGGIDADGVPVGEEKHWEDVEKFAPFAHRHGVDFFDGIPLYPEENRNGEA